MPTRFVASPFAIVLLVALGCSEREGAVDGGRVDGGRLDAGGTDSGGTDAGRADGGTDGGGTDSGMCPPPPTEIPYDDRLEDEEFTDPASCSGCPAAFTGIESLDIDMLPPGATTLDISGASAGSSSCEWWVIGGACGVTHGRLDLDPDGSGFFSATVPVFCGTNVIRIVCENDAGTRVLVRRIEGTACDGRDLRLTIAWDALGDDWELHLVRPGGTINSPTDDCTWFTCMPSLDWGVVGDSSDDPMKDVDDLDSFGPENIYLDNAPDGTYHVFVEHWGSGGLPSMGSIDVTIREATVAHLERTGFAYQQVWFVGTVAFPEGRFVPSDTIIDCSTAWMITSRGCDLMLP